MGSRATCRPSIPSSLHPEPHEHRAHPRDARPARGRRADQSQPRSSVGGRLQPGRGRSTRSTRDRGHADRSQRQHHRRRARSRRGCCRDRIWSCLECSDIPCSHQARRESEQPVVRHPTRQDVERGVAASSRWPLRQDAQLQFEDLHSSVRYALARGSRRHRRASSLPRMCRASGS
jgi:hypothetical protein